MSDLGKAYVQIVPSAQGISGSISEVLGGEAASAGQKAGVSIAGGIGSALKGATTVLAAGTAAVTGAIVKGSQEVASYGDNIDKMSQKMGMSAQAYQEWDAVMQHSGTSMEAMKSSMKTLANAAVSNNKAFEELGITQEQLNSMSQEELFAATITALQNVEDTTTRTYLAGKTLGKGATELGALLNTSAEDTQKMRDRVHELGGVMGDDAVKAAAQFQDNMQDMQTAISGIGRGMISELLPSMNEIIAGFTSLITGEEGATEALTSGFSSLFDSLGGIMDNIVNKITELMPSIIEGISTILPQIIEMAAKLIISFAEALVQALPNLLTTVLPALAEAAINIIIALGEALITAAPQLIEAGFELFEMFRDSISGGDFLEKGQEILTNVLDGITQKLPELLQQGIEIITNIANGIMESLPSMIETAGQIIIQFASFLMENMPTILSAGAELLVNLVTGIVDNLPQIIESAIKVITQFIETFAEHLPDILKQGILLITKLVAGLIEAIPKIIAAMPKIIGAIVNAFAEIDWLELGKNIIVGIAEGILGAIQTLVDAAVNAAKAAFEAAKDFLGISSPSKKGIWMGEMLDEGMALGIEKNTGLVDDAISDLTDSATVNLTTNSVSGYNAAQPQANNDKMDLLLDILLNYLPEIAENKGVTTQELYNGLNRQLGVAIS